MALKPRHAQILDILREESAVLVRDVALRVGVSESTVRRDLTELQEGGHVRRVHGGAVLENDAQVEPPFELRQISHRREKDQVGRAAAALVQDGEVVFIDGGTTTQFIVPYLANRRQLTVVTCGLNIANALRKNEHIQTIVVGGELHVASQSFAGPLTLAALEAYDIRCDRAFIGCGGVSARHGITNRILDRIPLKRKVIALSSWVAVVADGSKLGVVTLGHVAPVTEVDCIVTDLSASPKQLACIERKGVEVLMRERARVAS